MTVITSIADLLEEKDKALESAIEALTEFRSPDCPGDGNCELESNYHWRGCPTVINPKIQKLIEAIKLR